MPELASNPDSSGSTPAGAPNQLLPLVYDELRKLAAARMSHERAEHTLNPTALVHEAYLRLNSEQRFQNRAHFFAAAAEAMRRVLVDRARQRNTRKHGGDIHRTQLDSQSLAGGFCVDSLDDILEIHAALERFETLQPLKAQVVKLRFFAGLTVDQVAAALSLSSSTVDNYWAYARAWLRAEIDHGQNSQK